MTDYENAITSQQIDLLIRQEVLPALLGKDLVVCLCGSTKFKELFMQINAALTLHGVVVLSPGVYSHADNITLTPNELSILHHVHEKKIVMSELVLVINPGNYRGDGLVPELALARCCGKPIVYLESEEPIGSPQQEKSDEA